MYRLPSPKLGSKCEKIVTQLYALMLENRTVIYITFTHINLQWYMWLCMFLQQVLSQQPFRGLFEINDSCCLSEHTKPTFTIKPAGTTWSELGLEQWSARLTSGDGNPIGALPSNVLFSSLSPRMWLRCWAMTLCCSMLQWFSMDKMTGYSDTWIGERRRWSDRGNEWVCNLTL